ncbi:MAG: recombination mediator RecR [Proteobacteria bacterium]|nr:recombination mediator RecR [Pseudomonadota bacterium]
MNHYPPSFKNLVQHLSKLPGIGRKTAERLAMHILQIPKKEAIELSRSILEIKEKARLCTRCFSLSDTEVCAICSNPSRQADMLCVVENSADMMAIEKSGAYKGLYHILQGVLSPMDGIGPDDIKLPELFKRIREGEIKEVILATGTNVEGESTSAYIAGKIASHTLKITRIASGVPIGGELKYIDQVTLKRAMETRHGF